ncbi:MAG: HNH endonuclease [Thiothrix sp.]
MAKWPYNGKVWEQLRAQQLRHFPLCRYCEEMGWAVPAKHVDHIEPVRANPDRAFDPDNLQSLCVPCHNGIKRLEELRGHRVGCDKYGTPLHGW